MKKKELSQMKSLYASKDIVDTVYRDAIVMKTERWNSGYEYKYKTCKYFLYFRAAVENEILKVFVYSRKWLLKGRKEPEYIVFIDKRNEEFITLDPAENKWRTAKIDMLHFDTGGYSRYYSTENYQTETTRKIVNDYFGTKKIEVKKVILEFQNKVRKDELSRKHRREIDEIDEVMNEVPELPKNFNDWVIRNCFRETLFYKPDRKHKRPDVFCTHCGKWVPSPEIPKHGEKCICPNCKTEATYRSWNKQKYVTEDVDVAIIQKLKDETGYVLRRFECRLKRTREKGWENVEFRKYEELRATLNENFTLHKMYSYEEYKNTGVLRWCYAIDGSRWYGYYTPSFGTAYMFTPNLKIVLKNEAFGKMNLKRMFYGGERKRVDPINVLVILGKHPYLEYFEKSGLSNLVNEIMEHKEQRALFDVYAKRIHEVLMLDKQRFQRLRKLNGGCHILAALQYERQSGEKITDAGLMYIQKNKIDIQRLGLNRTNLSIQKALNFLERQQELNGFNFEETRRYYEDYLNMAEERGMDLTDEIVCKNTRMMEFHNRYLEEKNQKQNTKRDKEVNRKFQEIANNYADNKEHFEWQNEHFVIVVPKQASDITKEGRLQHHCVGASDNYMRKMAKKETFILFLRHIESQNIPYYTLEVKWDGSIIQAYAAYDRKPEYRELVEPLLEKFKKQISKRMLEESKKDMMNESLQDNIQMLYAAG